MAAQENTEEDNDFRQKVMSGCFLPAVALLERGLIDVEIVVDSNEGLRLLHYASYFGKAKALRVLCEVYEADISAKDFRG